MMLGSGASLGGIEFSCPTLASVAGNMVMVRYFSSSRVAHSYTCLTFREDALHIRSAMTYEGDNCPWHALTGG